MWEPPLYSQWILQQKSCRPGRNGLKYSKCWKKKTQTKTTITGRAIPKIQRKSKVYPVLPCFHNCSVCLAHKNLLVRHAKGSSLAFNRGTLTPGKYKTHCKA